MLASSETRHPRRLQAAPFRRQDGGREVPYERISDCWPDFSTELIEDECEASQWKNRPGIVLKEAARAILYSVGLVILLMAVL